jgi:hypothetical protein
MRARDVFDRVGEWLTDLEDNPSIMEPMEPDELADSMQHNYNDDDVLADQFHEAEPVDVEPVDEFLPANDPPRGCRWCVRQHG